MKTSPSSICNTFLALIFLLLFLTITPIRAFTQVSQSRLPEVSSTSTAKYQQRLCSSRNAISRKNMRIPPAMMCYQLNRIRYCRPYFPTPSPLPSPPSSSSQFEIDPRFGEEKRLVPSGPNPLHN